MAAHTFAFVSETLRRLRQAGMPLWIFGGWAEELWQMTLPRPHNDIDLLYRAESFDTLDHVIAAEAAFTEIPLKRFSHKRAFMYQGVMVEVFLVQGQTPHLVTSFFAGRYTFDWPPDTVAHTLYIDQQTINVASRTALTQYRQQHAAIAQAYAAALHDQKA
jgi:hypothetical protein